MDPMTAWTVVIVAGVALLILLVVLVRKWDRENRAKYPDRFPPGKLFGIDRTPRR
ncbi:hypothetical protein [Pseudarthrobacter sp. LMD1-1-1.1]|uniref:hypothetical protein n=1 Tax=Pseudarthrobacter sp. LMD1-1-1.1 TaxID=3135242 RepID=UPI0034364367